MPSIELRPATPADAPAIAAIHVSSWNSSYTGLLPESYLAEHTFDHRLACWTERLAHTDPEITIQLGLCDGQAAGFAAGGREREGLTGADGELYSIYLVKEAQGQGLGARLASRVARDLAALGMRSMSVWVLARNPARRFYEALGARPVVCRQGSYGGEVFNELGYRWDDIRVLLDY